MAEKFGKNKTIDLLANLLTRPTFRGLRFLYKFDDQDIGDYLVLGNTDEDDYKAFLPTMSFAIIDIIDLPILRETLDRILPLISQKIAGYYYIANILTCLKKAWTPEGLDTTELKVEDGYVYWGTTILFAPFLDKFTATCIQEPADEVLYWFKACKSGLGPNEHFYISDLPPMDDGSLYMSIPVRDLLKDTDEYGYNLFIIRGTNYIDAAPIQLVVGGDPVVKAAVWFRDGHERHYGTMCSTDQIRYIAVKTNTKIYPDTINSYNSLKNTGVVNV